MTEDEMYDIIRGYEESELDYHERNIELENENAKLRELCKPKYAIDPFGLMVYENAQLMEENAKLRELIADVHEALKADRAGMFHRLTLASMEDDMQELGIEVRGK